MTEQNLAADKKSQRVVVGTVVSDKMDKTVVVQIERKEKHPLYGKYVKKSTKMHAHDEANTSRVGDIVKIEQSKPLSKKKRWKLLEVVKRQEQE